MMRSISTFTLAFLITSMTVWAQIDGLWIVRKVTVGNQVMTPVAKWVRFDHQRHTSGNGWLQHTFGTYTYDKKKSTLDIKNDNEPNDDFGPFSVKVVTRDEMTWTRMEEGENIVVDLKRSSGLNMSPSDEIHGLWKLQKVLKGDSDLTQEYDPQEKYTMFIQWTHNYVINTGTEKITGLWFVNAHRPELRLLRSGRENEADMWEISFPWPPEGKGLVLKGISDNNNEIVMVFKPLLEFPK